MGHGQLHRPGFAGGKIDGGGAGGLGLSHLVGAFNVDAYGVVFSLAWGRSGAFFASSASP